MSNTHKVLTTHSCLVSIGPAGSDTKFTYNVFFWCFFSISSMYLVTYFFFDWMLSRALRIVEKAFGSWDGRVGIATCALGRTKAARGD